jgi:hypothetical protein
MRSGSSKIRMDMLKRGDLDFEGLAVCGLD